MLSCFQWIRRQSGPATNIYFSEHDLDVDLVPVFEFPLTMLQKIDPYNDLAYEDGVMLRFYTLSTEFEIHINYIPTYRYRFSIWYRKSQWWLKGMLICFGECRFQKRKRSFCLEGMHIKIWRSSQ